MTYSSAIVRCVSLQPLARCQHGTSKGYIAIPLSVARENWIEVVPGLVELEVAVPRLRACLANDVGWGMPEVVVGSDLIMLVCRGGA